MMMKFTGADYDLITECVGEAEEKTTAEFVVVIRHRSGNYRDVNYLCGAVVAWAGLLFILFSPYTVPPETVPFDILLLFALAAWLCSATPSAHRLLTTARRRQRQVKEAAEVAFVEEGVTHTRARTGVLFYLSAMERRVEMMADTGVQAALPAAEWDTFLSSLKAVEEASKPAPLLLERIRELGRLLARYMPAGEDNPDEIPNRARVER